MSASEVISQERMPLIGEKFPEVEVATTHGRLKLPDYFTSKGKWFVLFSHPADFTPVCTTEFYSFSLYYPEFEKLNTGLIGLSVDGNPSHISWVQWIERNLKIKVPFPIIADPLGLVARRLGMFHAQSATNTVRAVFFVDSKATIRAIIYYPLELGRNVKEILRVVKTLQLIDKTGAVAPANWPNNEIIKDNLLNPTPASVEEASLRLTQFKGYDWWFTFREAPREDVEEAKKYAP
ncbi:Peroxiredoxin [Acidilobus saccharovorans 345-15]|uniref:Peroxiredoxin n=1 Tax=Acidilobus saccharovorans (strain DSM 16705 / JCM 18335 / VKM B-2471 / 345-15) TaxID=666510 RepID=D9Q103_ACIS3|nr:peroxiredoxin [Acidilobus saccharovorans]ADL18991.1 Peroxiredoxin [Acidilobus saccharovorans 345-15]